MIRYQDFVPQMTGQAALFTPATYEPFDAALALANKWVKENGIRVIQIETVVLPNIWSRWEEGSQDTSLATSGESASHWHQFIRIWYQEG